MGAKQAVAPEHLGQRTRVERSRVGQCALDAAHGPGGRVGDRSSWASRRSSVDGSVVFAAHSARFGTELWEAGVGSVRQVADIHPGRDSSSPSGLTVIGRDVYFAADDGTHGTQLWRAAPAARR